MPIYFAEDKRKKGTILKYNSAKQRPDFKENYFTET